MEFPRSLFKPHDQYAASGGAEAAPFQNNDFPQPHPLSNLRAGGTF
jgi:hypothetical protein